MYQIPHVLRARNFRLYLARGTSRQKANRRLVDLWLNGGAAVLGHTPPNLLRELKNAASRGLYAPLPHFAESRFLKALSKLLPGRSFRIYAAPPLELASLTGNTDLDGLDGFTRIKKEGERKLDANLKLWRPYIDPLNPFAVNDTPILIPVLPGIQTWRGELPIGLCVIAALTGNNASEEMLKYIIIKTLYVPNSARSARQKFPSLPCAGNFAAKGKPPSGRSLAEWRRGSPWSYSAEFVT